MIATLATAAALGSLAVQQEARPGTDIKTVPGTQCKPMDGADLGSAFYSTSGRMFNTHSSNQMDVICPLVRDNVAGDQGVDAASIVVQKPASDGGNDQVTCEFFSAEEDGTFVDSQDETTSGSDPIQTLNTYGIAADIDAEIDGMYYVKCTLPRCASGSGEACPGIFRIVYTENT
jgi:hypothetical protein